MTKPWKLVLLLVGIFAAGLVAGSFLTVRFARRFIEKRPTPEQWAPARLKMLAERLELTPEQQERLRPILHRDMEELGKVREATFRESRVILERMERDIAAILTAEQKARFEKMNREMRERFQRFNLRGPGRGEGLQGGRGPGLRPPGEEAPPDGPPPLPPEGRPPGN